MKKNTIITAGVIIIIIIIALITWGHKRSSPTDTTLQNLASELPSTVASTTKVSSTLTKYENDELGFTVTYPNAWSLVDEPAGPSFIVPARAAGETSTGPFASIEAGISFTGGNCTLKGSSTKINGLSFVATSSTQTSHGKKNFKHVYALSQDSVCYVFSLDSAVDSSIASAHQPIISAADDSFIEMVKSFAPVVGPSGDSEATHPKGK
jgi:hypothetical protein